MYHCITFSLITTSLPLIMTEPYVHTYSTVQYSTVHTYILYILTYIHTYIHYIHTFIHSYIHTAAYCTESRQAAVETSSEPQQPQSVIDPLEVRGGLRVIDE